jgi:hypothetical protein
MHPRPNRAACRFIHSGDLRSAQRVARLVDFDAKLWRCCQAIYTPYAAWKRT